MADVISEAVFLKKLTADTYESPVHQAMQGHTIEPSVKYQTPKEKGCFDFDIQHLVALSSLKVSDVFWDFAYQFQNRF